MNAAIRAATLVARAQGVGVVGIERGHRGLLDGAFVPLAPADVAIIRRGSSGADPRLGALQGVPPPRNPRPGARRWWHAGSTG